ncbi:hypothetical protein [Streptomyces sp. SCL15-4]|uniref:hypothetical protein n=1 Tax=Streptomyces sp. SCL15-4 TaxID=2967221 RepID=UPI002967544A|nr:hypothetical protein [Streptomyces sp. SCL15-4]
MDIDWGTIPAWVSGLGSTGALWVGAVTLRRAQNKESRSEAEAVVCRDERGDCCGYDLAAPYWIASAANGSERPIHNVYLITYDSETDTMGERHLLANMLPPVSPTTSISPSLPQSGPGRRWSSSATPTGRGGCETSWSRACTGKAPSPASAGSGAPCVGSREKGG